MALVLKTSTSSSTTKVTRTLAEKVQVLILINEGTSVREALSLVFGATATPAMEKHPHSILSGYKASVQKAIDAGDEGVIEALEAAGLVEED